MKIALLISGFPPRRYSGAEAATASVAAKLAHRGHEVHVITVGDSEFNGTKKDSFSTHFLRLLGGDTSTLAALTYGIRGFLEVARLRPDIIHSQRFYREGLCAFLAKKLLGTPYCVTCHGPDIYLPWRFKGLATNLFLGNASAVIALTAYMRDTIRRRCRKPVYVIPNGIQLDRFDTCRQRAGNGTGASPTTLLFVGRLHPNKGVPYLLHAMHKVVKECDSVQLLILGDGPEREQLVTLAQKLSLGNHVSFAGRVSNEEVLDRMASSDIFVLPSIAEGLPVVTLEALASGLPIVETDIVGVSEVVTEGENGFLVKPRDPVELADRIIRLLKDPELRQRMSENNLRKAQTYSWDSVVDRIEQVYQEVLEGGNGS
jgi:glycosyltransferase involved in cell wall biosynthesis